MRGEVRGVLRERSSGRFVTTRVVTARAHELRRLGNVWRFDWTGYGPDEVFKLIVEEDPTTIQGLVCLKPRPDHVKVELIESHPANVGANKQYEGVAGNLLAFAALTSLTLGLDGCLVLDAKTGLIGHYVRVYGFMQIGRSRRLALDEVAALRLVETYFVRS